MKKRCKARSRAMALTPEMQDAIMGMPTHELTGELARAIMEYAFYGTECESDNDLVMAEFGRLKGQIDQSVTEAVIREAGYTRWGDIKSVVRSWWFVIRIRLWRAFHKTEG